MVHPSWRRVPTRSEEARTRHMAARHVTRYVATYVNGSGMRTLMHPAQGHYTYGTPEEAQRWIDAAFKVNSKSTLVSLFGINPRPEVRPCPCYERHFDPVSVWFD